MNLLSYGIIYLDSFVIYFLRHVFLRVDVNINAQSTSHRHKQENKNRVLQRLRYPYAGSHDRARFAYKEHSNVHFHSPQAQIACERALRGALAKTIISALP